MVIAFDSIFTRKISQMQHTRGNIGFPSCIFDINIMLGILTLWTQSEVVFLKIHILCDLHVEFGNFVPPAVCADVVVLAGDVHVKDRGLQWIFDQKLREFLARGDPARTIVVTHHAPSIKSIADRYRADPVSAAFASNMDDFILEHQPRLWIHGHTHESFDYKIGKTRVVCNPRGYASTEENKGFRPDYTLVV
jgi:predicted phosphodiesterase